jgi:hypothetical protein
MQDTRIYPSLRPGTFSQGVWAFDNRFRTLVPCQGSCGAPASLRDAKSNVAVMSGLWAGGFPSVLKVLRFKALEYLRALPTCRARRAN